MKHLWVVSVLPGVQSCQFAKWSFPDEQAKAKCSSGGAHQKSIFAVHI